jgi:two-component system chemotaxis sensor kinase CheA
MPVIQIDRILGTKYHSIDYREGMVIVVELEQKFKAIPISSVLGKQEIVVKPLGPDFRKLDFVSGATILGDGKVSLILDIEYLFKTELINN